MSGFIPTDYSSGTPGKNGGGVIHHTQFIFPLLKTAEIVTCCSELEIELSKAELSEPQRHKERIKKVFWQFLDICFGITEEDLTKKLPSTDTFNSISDYPDLHDEHLLDLYFFRELANNMRVVGINDFSWKDLHHPVSKRFRCQMSAFINMAKFREEQLRKYYELMEPRNELVAALQEVNQEHELLSEQLQKTQAESAIQMGEIDAVVKECQDFESEIAKSNKLQASKREEAAALKREVNDLKDQLASATWALQESQAEEERLMGQIVSSPARRTQDLATKKEKLEKEKEEVRKLDEDMEENRAMQTRLKQTIKELVACISLQKQVLEEAVKYDGVVKQINETEKEIAENESKTKEISDKTEEAERESMRAEEKLHHSRKQAKMKMDAAHDRLEIAKEQLLLVEKERREGMARVEAGEAEVRELEAQMEAERKETEEEIADLIAEYKETENAFLARNERIMNFITAAT